MSSTGSGELKRRELCLVVILALLLAGCAASSKLQSALGNKYKYSVSMTGPVQSKDMLFRDEQLMIQFRMDDPGLRFQLQNISPADMRIDWARATISVHGVSSPIRHLPSFYDTARALPATQAIPSLGVIRDAVLPRGNCYFDGTQWRVDDLLPTIDANTHTMRNTILRMAGTTIEFHLPIESGLEARSYVFSFVVDSVQQISWNGYRPASWIPPRPQVKLLRPTREHQITAVIIAGGFLGFFSYMMSMKQVPVVE
jgi:hypothetical protein